MKFKYNIIAAGILMAAAASAEAQIYKVTLSGANENPPVVTNGTGSGVVTLNTTTHELRIKAVFSGLNGNTSASHIHCCVATPTANAGVFTATPSFPGFPLGVKEGSFDATYNTSQNATWNATAITGNGGTAAGAEAALATGAAAGGAYLNIHSTTSGGGEIRGTLVRFSFAPAANTATSGVAAALDSLGAGTGVVNERLVALAMLNTSQQTSALVSLLPVASSVVSTLASNALFADYDQIGNRLGGLRVANETGTGFWVKAGDHDGEQELASRSVDVDSDGWDVAGGLDFQLSANTLLGASLSYGDDSFDYSGLMLGSSGSLSGWRATVYGEQRIGTGFIEGMLTMANYDSDSVRNAGVAGAAMGSTESDQWGGRVAAGLLWELGTGVSLTPQVRLDWSSLDIDGYQESNAGGMALNIGSQSEDRMRASVGGQLDWTMSPTIKPYVRAFLGSELEDDDSVTNATFAAGGAPFVVRDAGLDSSSYVLGIGVNITSGSNFGAALSYDRTDSDTYQTDMLQAKALWRF